MVPNIISVYEKVQEISPTLPGPQGASEKCPKTPWEGVTKQAMPPAVQQTLQQFLAGGLSD